MKGRIHSFESFGTVDGPGIRFVIFLEGCMFRCQYCHNPDTWTGKGTLYEVDEVVDKIKRYKSYISNAGGGITVSGGEPLLQIDFVTELFKKVKAEGLTTTIDTSGFYDLTSNESKIKIDELLAVTDLVMLDIKQINDGKHKKLTGHSNRKVIDFAKYVSNVSKTQLWIRYVLVPTVTDDVLDMNNLRKFIDTLETVTKVEVLPYHKMGIYKWEQLGLTYELKGIEPPTKEQIKVAEDILVKKYKNQN